MTQMTIAQAIDAGIAEELGRDERVLFFGEGVATKRKHLVDQFGADRVRNTPLAEGVIAGTAVGAAAMGLRPVIDLLFAPFMCYAMEEIVNSAGKLRYISGGQVSFPMVTLAMTGTGWTTGAQHNHNLEAWFVHAPGLKVVMPSTAADYKGLIKSAIRDENPVICFSDIGLMFEASEVPEGEHVVPLGKANVRQEGKDVSIITYGKTVNHSLAAAQTLSESGISAEVVDLRTLKPLDQDTILASVKKTGRAVIVHEANLTCGVGAEVSALLAEKAFSSLKGPIVRLASPDVPAPSSWALEQAFTPQAPQIAEAATRLVKGE